MKYHVFIEFEAIEMPVEIYCGHDERVVLGLVDERNIEHTKRTTMGVIGYWVEGDGGVELDNETLEPITQEEDYPTEEELDEDEAHSIAFGYGSRNE